MIRRILWLIVLMVFSVIPSITLAEDYPTKAITLICALPPGGSLDLTARIFAPVAEKYLGKPVVILNKTGAAGAVGTLAAAQAPPDGYTLCMGWSAQTQLIIGEILAGRKPSFTIDDFVVLGRTLKSSPICLVPYNSPWKTIQEAIEEVKSHPNKYSFSSGGIYSTSHIPFEIFISELGLKLRHVPFQGGGPSFTALIGGHVAFCAQFPGPTLPKIKAKQVRALAQFGEERQKNYEDIPTFKELGYNVVYAQWIGFLAPKGIPDPVKEKLQNVVRQVTSDPTYIDVFEKSGDQVRYADLETMKKEWKEEYDKVYKLLEQLEKEKKQ